MIKILKLLLLIISAIVFIFGWLAWSVVHDVIGQHFGAFGFQQFLLILSGMGFAGLMVSLVLAVKFSRIIVGLCGLLGSVISIHSLAIYPREETYLHNGAVLNPSPDELIASILFGGFLLLTAMFWGWIISHTKKPAV
ncbi:MULTISPECIES: hypothetical protein [unclassified Acidovorax]|uniref:hypothetical protein n=1 Tax=unclassified Acidovorax TaxID=2684926 RepID=UPI000B24E0AD|nr:MULTISPECIES: hypothetical protein [unclassified Acidovorax]